jgi:hypothetical protein
MALEFTTRSPVTCKVCKKPAVRRTIAAEGLHVSYDTHVHAGHKEHFAALERLDRFHLMLVRRERALRALPEADRKLSAGWLKEFDLGSVHPEACERRELLTGEATVRAFGLQEIVEIEPVPLRTSVAKLLKLFKAKGEEAVLRLKAKKESGDY